MRIKQSLALLGISSLLLSAPSFAADMEKDTWLAKLKEVAPDTICKSFVGNAEVNKQMITANVNYDKCLTLIPASFDKCRNQYYSEIPATISVALGEKWGTTLGECIGTDFALNNFLKTPSDTVASDSSTTSSSSTSDMSKDEWFTKIKAIAPDLICKGFLADPSLKEQLTKLNINYEKCITLIPASADKCQTSLYSSIPSTINKESGEKWGSNLGECIGKDFAVKYLLTESGTPAN